uniref:Glutamine amidotransferase domain-containing protein n=1 Tax=Grammatophora oceanica TaxID=210454 RepID=A0A7S1YM07_9STRA
MTADQDYKLLGEAPCELYYTHGDMVKELPICAKSLGGNGKVPIEAAMYMNEGKVVAVTFQAHPEYATSDLGFKGTFQPILKSMEEREDITAEERIKATQDAEATLGRVKKQSVNAVIMAGTQLGWFP